MSYFDQLNSYMTGLNEATSTENSMKQEQISSKTSDIEDQFNQVVSKIEGVGGSITGLGGAFQLGRKVYKKVLLTKAKQAKAKTGTDPDGTTTNGGGGSNGSGDSTDNIFDKGSNQGKGKGKAKDDDDDDDAGDAGDAGGGGGAADAPNPNAAPSAEDIKAPDIGAPVDDPVPVSSAADSASDSFVGQLFGKGKGKVRQADGGGAEADEFEGTFSDFQKGGAVIKSQVGGNGAGADMEAIKPVGANPSADMDGSNSLISNLRSKANSIVEQAKANLPQKKGTNSKGKGDEDADADAGAEGGADAGGDAATTAALEGANMLDVVPVLGEIVGVGTLLGGLFHDIFGHHNERQKEAEATSTITSGVGVTTGGIDTASIMNKGAGYLGASV